MEKKSGYSMELETHRGCRVTITVKVDPQKTKEFYKKAVKRINNQISLPGFRKGKAPEDIVIQRHPSYVDQEWKEILVQETFKAAIDSTKVYPLNKETIERPKIEECSLENGSTVIFSFERYPEIPKIDFSTIRLPQIEKQPISEQRVNDIIEEIRHRLADWENVEDRQVEPGDYVDLTIESIDEDPPKPIAKNRRFKVEEKSMARWLYRLLIGMAIGAVTEATSELDENADESVKAQFKQTRVRITLHAIKKIILPNLDDELAKKTGAESKDDLLEKIRNNLEIESSEIQREQRIAALNRLLLDQYTFDLPSSLVSSQRNNIYEQRRDELKELTSDQRQEREREMENEITQEAEESLRLYFINKQIAEQGHISVSREELNDGLVKEISKNPRYFGKKLDKETIQNLIAQITNSIMRKKVHDYALAQVLN